MAAASKLLSIGIIALSLVAAYISFYFMSNLSKEHKKQQINEVTSQIINFIVFIWVAKIILNFSLFTQDPLAVLAHPSSSNAFYLAILFTSLLLLYKMIRRKLNMLVFLESFTHIFLTASFLYEFIQFITENNPYAFGYLILLALLLMVFFFLHERLKNSVLLFVILTGWAIGVLILLLFQPFVTVFGYTMAPWFVGLFFVFVCSIIILKRKCDS